VPSFQVARQLSEQAIEQVKRIGKLALANDERWSEQQQIPPCREGDPAAQRLLQ
jgi:hypothetical protein